MLERMGFESGGEGGWVSGEVSGIQVFSLRICILRRLRIGRWRRRRRGVCGGGDRYCSRRGQCANLLRAPSVRGHVKG
jgi:hypothetical protein